MTDKMREAFELWWKAVRRPLMLPDYVKEDDWETWQAAQAAQAVPVVGEVVAWAHGARHESDVITDSVKKVLIGCYGDKFEAFTTPLIVQPTHSISAAELERLRKDAERYRWLRMKGAQSDNLDKVHYFGPRLDEAPDAAIAAEGEKE